MGSGPVASFDKQLLNLVVNQLALHLEKSAGPTDATEALLARVQPAYRCAETFGQFLFFLNPTFAAQLRQNVGTKFFAELSDIIHSPNEELAIQSLTNLVQRLLLAEDLASSDALTQAILALKPETFAGQQALKIAQKRLAILSGNGSFVESLPMSAAHLFNVGSDPKFWVPMVLAGPVGQVVRAKTALGVGRTGVAWLGRGTIGRALVAGSTGIASEVGVATLGSTSLAYWDGDSQAFHHFGERLQHMGLAVAVFRVTGLGAQWGLAQVGSTSLNPWAMVARKAVPHVTQGSALGALQVVEQGLGWQPQRGGGWLMADVLTQWGHLNLLGPVTYDLQPLSLRKYLGKLHWDMVKVPGLGEPKWAWQTPAGPFISQMSGKGTEPASRPGAHLFPKGKKSSWPSRQFSKLDLDAIAGPLEEVPPFYSNYFSIFRANAERVYRHFTRAGVDSAEIRRDLQQLSVSFNTLDAMLPKGARSRYRALLLHDINNSVAVLKGYAELLPGGKQLSPERLKDIEFNYYLIDDLFSLASGRMPTQRAIQWGELTHRVSEYLSSQAQVTVRLHYRESSGYPGLVFLALKNLAVNSVAYQNPVVPLRVNLEVYRHWVKYEDNGSGIPTKFLGDLLEFGNRAGRTDDAGTGVGTYAVAKAVAVHDGALRIESAVGKGTRFELRFGPLRSTRADYPPQIMMPNDSTQSLQEPSVQKWGRDQLPQLSESTFSLGYGNRVADWERFVARELQLLPTDSVTVRVGTGGPSIPEGLARQMLQLWVQNAREYAPPIVNGIPTQEPRQRWAQMAIQVDPQRIIYQDNSVGMTPSREQQLQQIVGSLGGTLQIQSVPGVGTRYEINFPMLH
ncbi:MAG: sensor histidine kinase [Deltaproteobacteria bacterium]|nr:sensor histidine kinase [Deltaproteobacteria bacterium]